jgi:RNA polymerase sigma-70 factor, ECF subfamily
MEKKELFMTEFYPCLPALYRSAFKLTWDKVDAEELVAKTVEKVIKNLDNYTQQDKPLAFMRTVARNIFLNDCKKLKSRKTFLVEEETFLQLNETSEDQFIDLFCNLLEQYDTFSDEVVAALAQIRNEEHFKVFACTMDGYKSAEIAEELDILENTVKGIIRRVRVKLIPILRDYAFETYGIVADIKLEQQQPFEA